MLYHVVHLDDINLHSSLLLCRIANMTKMGVYQNAGPEKSATSTKSFTTQVVCMALVAMWFRQTKAKEMGLKLSNEQNILAESLQRLPISFGMLMRTQNACKKAAKKLLPKEHCFVLGKGCVIQVLFFCLPFPFPSPAYHSFYLQTQTHSSYGM